MWTLLLARANDPPGAFIDRRQLDAGQIKVGRNARTCDWVLPDDTGHISREHCTISAMGLDLFVVDTSTNGVALNRVGERIAPQLPVAIRINDRLLLGDYVIQIATEAVGAGMALIPPPPPPLPGGAARGIAQPDAWFDAPIDPVWGGDTRDADVHEFLGNAMHDFLGGPAPSQAAPPMDPGWGGAMAGAFSRPIMAEVLPPPADFGIPEDWLAPAAGKAPAEDPFAALPADPFAGFAPPPGAGAAFSGLGPAIGNDPFALPMVVPAAASPTAEPRAAASPAAAGSDANWAAFCEGAGLGADELQLSSDAMHRLGVLYRQVVLGLSDLIQDRAAFKDEFRVERTQLSMGRNNPLKHLPPLDTARILLGAPLPGFMPADEAVRTAFEDVKKHQLAMLAGVQHALGAVFDRLSPAEIDRLMAKAQGAKRGLPFTRGINPWTVYQTVFEALKRDAVSNANSVMSTAFRDGYEKFLKAGH